MFVFASLGTWGLLAKERDVQMLAPLKVSVLPTELVSAIPDFLEKIVPATAVLSIVRAMATATLVSVPAILATKVMDVRLRSARTCVL